MGTSITIDDKKFRQQVDKLLNTFGKPKKKEILRKATRPVVVSMQKSSLWGDYTGEARRQVKSMTWSKSESYFVGFKRGNFISKRKRKGKYSKYDPYYMKFVEKGFKNHWSKKFIPAKNIIPTVFAAKESEVIAKIRDEVEKELGQSIL